jgi:hypothetical protein
MIIEEILHESKRISLFFPSRVVYLYMREKEISQSLKSAIMFYVEEQNDCDTKTIQNKGFHSQDP